MISDNKTWSFAILVFKVLFLTSILQPQQLHAEDNEPDIPTKAITEEGIFAEIQTSKGSIYLELYYEKTPLTVTNFVGLAEGSLKTNKPDGTKFYDGLTFHRVIKDFMIQGGCPEGTGRGGPGYKFTDEFVDSLVHDGPGILSMANAGPGTNGSQFFITHKATPWLNNKHTVFGKVIKGQDIVNKIEKGDQIKRVKIIRNGAKAQSFKADQESFLLRQKEVKDEKAKKKQDQNKQFGALKEKLKDAKKTESGLKYVVTKEGSGVKPEKGSTIKAHYTGMLMDGTKFDSSRDRNQEFQFKVGTGQVIKGWDEAFLDMRKGEKRLLMIPSNLAYGERGAPPVIPPGATLIFDVELIDIK